MTETALSPLAVHRARPTVRVDTQAYATVDELTVAMEMTEQDGGMSSLELRLIDHEPAWQPQEREVITVTTERQDPAALRTEMLVNGSTGTTVPAFQCRDGLRRDWIASHRRSSRRLPTSCVRPQRSCRNRRSASRSGC